MSTVADRLYELAESQAGYFTSAQASDVGVSHQELRYLRQRGDVRQVAHGIQRLVRFPSTPFEDVVVAHLWVGADSAASHETALVVFGIGDAMPQRIHVTVPRAFRGMRHGITVHRADLGSDEVTMREGVRVTAPLRSVADVAAVSPALAAAGLRDAFDTGLIRRSAAVSAVRRYPELIPLLERLS